MNRPIAILPKLYIPKSSAKQQTWYVYFSYISPLTNKMERFRIWEGFSELKTRSEKEHYGKKLVLSYKRKLKNGWNPYDNSELLFKSDIKSNTIKRSQSETIEVYLWNAFNDIIIGLSPSAKKNYRKFTDGFIEFLKKQKLEQYDISCITGEHCDLYKNYLIELGRSNKYINDHIAYLKQAFKWLLKKKIVFINPCEEIEKLKKKQKPGVYYKEGIKELLKKKLEKDFPYLWLYINFIYYTCIRPKELRKLKIKDINVIDGIITVPCDISKNKKTQPVVIPFQLYEKLLILKLHQYPEHYYLFTQSGSPGEIGVGVNYFNKRFRKIRDNMGIPSDYKLYNWKHTANVTAVRAGINIKEMQMHNRHGDLNTFDIYIRSMTPEESEAIRYKYPTL